MATVDLALDDIIKASKASKAAIRAKEQSKKKPVAKPAKTKAKSAPAKIIKQQPKKKKGANSQQQNTGLFPARAGQRQQQKFKSIQRLPSGGLSTVAARQPPVQTGPAKLNISNLESGVTDTDVRDLFQEFGHIVSGGIHYNSAGQSMNFGHVVFGRYIDALKAQKQYNGVLLDGQKMIITIDRQQQVAGAGQAAAVGGGGIRQRLSGPPVHNQRGPQKAAGRPQQMPAKPKAMKGGKGVPSRLPGGLNKAAAGLKRLGSGPKPVQNQNAAQGAGKGKKKKNKAAKAMANGVAAATNQAAGKKKKAAAKEPKKAPPSVADLDAELDSYLRQAKNAHPRIEADFV